MWYLNGEDSLGLTYEKEIRANATTEHKHYVRAAGVTFAIYTSRAGTLNGLPTNSTSYLHTDHLGSIAVITNEAGAVAERLAYDPWGKRRFINTTPGQSDKLDTLVGIKTDRGYTEHEHLDEIGVIHMNGRVYDPLMGRFMSADSVVQEPLNLKSFNRYSYVWNNPLKLFDPTGYNASDDSASGAGYGSSNGEGDPSGVGGKSDGNGGQYGGNSGNSWSGQSYTHSPLFTGVSSRIDRNTLLPSNGANSISAPDPYAPRRATDMPEKNQIDDKTTKEKTEDAPGSKLKIQTKTTLTVGYVEGTHTWDGSSFLGLRTAPGFVVGTTVEAVSSSGEMAGPTVKTTMGIGWGAGAVGGAAVSVGQDGLGASQANVGVAERTRGYFGINPPAAVVGWTFR